MNNASKNCSLSVFWVTPFTAVHGILKPTAIPDRDLKGATAELPWPKKGGSYDHQISNLQYQVVSEGFIVCVWYMFLQQNKRYKLMDSTISSAKKAMGFFKVHPHLFWCVSLPMDRFWSGETNLNFGHHPPGKSAFLPNGSNQTSTFAD